MPLVLNPRNREPAKKESFIGRPAFFYVFLGILGLIFFSKLFYLQIIKGEYYRSQAASEHQKKFEIPAKRGGIYANDGERKVPLVLNETKKTIFADPRYVKDKDGTAKIISEVIGGETETYKKLLESNSAYVVLLKNVPKSKGEELAERQLKGIGQTDTPSRVYPQGNLGAQIIGFVNGEEKGQYGVEEFFNESLHGKTGQLKAVTDVNGVPLAAGENSVLVSPKDGEDIHLTIDINVQRKIEELLKETTEKSKAKSTSAIVIETKTGRIRAMGNYPTFDPSKFTEVTDYSVFSNRISSEPYEPGSVMKVFTMSSALDEGAVNPSSTFQDRGSVKVDDRTIKKSRDWGNGTKPKVQILQYSLNTGVVFLLEQLGGGQINQQAREKLHHYFVDKFRFSQLTGLEISGESKGLISEVTTGAGDNVRYANMTFGQGMNLTMIQVASALNSIINGGIYYRPTIIQKSDQPDVVDKEVIKQQTSSDIKNMMKQTIDASPFKKPGYYIGGKSGTSQLLDSSGNYSEDKTTGSYIGFVGSSDAEYSIMVRVDEPKTQGFSGTTVAGPLFQEVFNYLIDYYGIAPGA